jgi:hypothetical protein
MTAVSIAEISGPSFATVTLVFAGDGIPAEPRASREANVSAVIEPKTLRVPITPRTTIRELAKGAMARYMVFLRRAAKNSDLVARQLCLDGIVVTDVHLRSAHHSNDENVLVPPGADGVRRITGRPPAPLRVELFSDDCVTQVVQVTKEVIYMCFKGAAEHSKKRRAEQTSRATSTTTTSKPTSTAAAVKEASLASNVTPQAPPPQTSASGIPSGESWIATPSEHSVSTTTGGLATDDDVVCVEGSSGEHDKGDISMSMPLPPPMVGGAATATRSTATTTSTRETRASTKPAARRSASPSTSTADSDSNSDEGTTSNSSDDEEELQNIARSIATLRQAETRRMPWGPDAHKHFATNYVNSPQKIMTGRYNYKRQQPPPSVKLHHAQSTRKAPNAGAEKEKLAKPIAVEANVDAAPHKISRVEDVSSCDHSHVSVALTCGTSSTSTTPNTRSRVFPSGPTATAAAAVAGAAADPATMMEQSEEVAPQPPHKDEGSLTQAHQACVTVTSTTTPVSAVVNKEASPEVPRTVAKPVQESVARQLSFEEECEGGVSKAATQPDVRRDGEEQPVEVLSVQRIS